MIMGWPKNVHQNAIISNSIYCIFTVHSPHNRRYTPHDIIRFHSIFICDHKRCFVCYREIFVLNFPVTVFRTKKCHELLVLRMGAHRRV